MSNTDKTDTVVANWTGQDGNQWRELRVWSRGRFVYFNQRHIGGGVWV